MPYRFWGLLDSCLAALETDEFAKFNSQSDRASIIVNNEGANIKNQFTGGTFNNPTFN
jgi:hypothetical protein